MNIATHYPWPNNITKTISQKPETIGITYTTDSEETDSESDCGYEGRVDCDPSDDSAADSDEDWSDDESLAELEGDELEANTFDTLKENMPKALASMELQTIRRWEHRMFRWVGAYRGDDRCSETGEGIQFHKIQVTQACSGSRRSYF